LRNIPEFRRNFREVRELSLFHQESGWQLQMIELQIYVRIVDLGPQRNLLWAGLLAINWINRFCRLILFTLGAKAIWMMKVMCTTLLKKTLLNYGLLILT
jgi:hypothetical protein